MPPKCDLCATFECMVCGALESAKDKWRPFAAHALSERSFQRLGATPPEDLASDRRVANARGCFFHACCNKCGAAANKTDPRLIGIPGNLRAWYPDAKALEQLGFKGGACWVPVRYVDGEQVADHDAFVNLVDAHGLRAFLLAGAPAPRAAPVASGASAHASAQRSAVAAPPAASRAAGRMASAVTFRSSSASASARRRGRAVNASGPVVAAFNRAGTDGTAARPPSPPLLDAGFGGMWSLLEMQPLRALSLGGRGALEAVPAVPPRLNVAPFPAIAHSAAADAAPWYALGAPLLMSDLENDAPAWKRARLAPGGGDVPPLPAVSPFPPSHEDALDTLLESFNDGQGEYNEEFMASLAAEIALEGDLGDSMEAAFGIHRASSDTFAVATPVSADVAATPADVDLFFDVSDEDVDAVAADMLLGGTGLDATACLQLERRQAVFDAPTREDFLSLADWQYSMDLTETGLRGAQQAYMEDARVAVPTVALLSVDGQATFLASVTDNALKMFESSTRDREIVAALSAGDEERALAVAPRLSERLLAGVTMWHLRVQKLAALRCCFA